MNFWNFIVIAYLCKLNIDIIKKIISSSYSKQIQSKNSRLDELRDKIRLTHKEQLEFISLKNPDLPKFNKSLMLVIFISILTYIAMFYTINFVFVFFGFNLNFFYAVLNILAFSIIVNFFLSYFNLEQDNIFVRHLKAKFSLPTSKEKIPGQEKDNNGS